jgi:hypothetical protein
MRTYVYTYTHTLIHIHMHSYIHTYIDTYIHKYTHTHTKAHPHFSFFVIKMFAVWFWGSLSRPKSLTINARTTLLQPLIWYLRVRGCSKCHVFVCSGLNTGEAGNWKVTFVIFKLWLRLLDFVSLMDPREHCVLHTLRVRHHEHRNDVEFVSGVFT